MENIKRLPIPVDRDDTDSSIRQILLEIRPDWPKGEISIQNLKGGLANQIFKCKVVGDKRDQDAINIKVFGNFTTALTGYDSHTIVRLGEIMFAANIGQAIYATFTNGMAYRFLQGSALTIQEYCENKMIPRYLAETLASLHSIDPDSYHVTTKGPSIVFPKYNEPLKWLHHLLEQLPDDESEFATGNVGWHQSKTALSKEYLFLLDEFKGHGKNCINAFCHGDLTVGNIIFDEHGDKLQLIDFEMSGFGCGLRDLALFIITAPTEVVEGQLCLDKELPEADQMNLLKLYIEASSCLQNKIYNEENIDWELIYKHLLLESAAIMLTYAASSFFHQEKSINGIHFKCLAQEDLKVYYRQKQKYLSYKKGKDSTEDGTNINRLL